MRNALRCLGLVLVAVSLAACDKADLRYFSYGIGTDLYTPDIAEVTARQDIYLSALCQQSLPILSASDAQCVNTALGPADWTRVVQAGMNDINRRCDAYLAWLDDRKRTNNAVLKELGDIAVASQAIMRVAGASANPITLAGLAFGLASNTFTNVNSRLLLEVDKTTVQTLVLRRRDDFRVSLSNKIIPDRPTAVNALQLYVTICTPFAIETDINSTVTIFQQNGAAGLANTAPLVNPEVVAAPVIRSATAPIAPIRRPPPESSLTGGLNSYERSLQTSEIVDFQKAVCISPQSGLLGPLGSETRTKIQSALGASDQLLSDRKGIQLRRILRAGPAC